MKPARDETKLPKWAQNELNRLRRSLEHERKKLAEGPEDSNTFADPYADVPRPLGKDTTIEFTLPGSDGSIPNKIRVRIDGDSLDVNGNDSISVYPRASNSLNIKMERLH